VLWNFPIEFLEVTKANMFCKYGKRGLLCVFLCFLLSGCGYTLYGKSDLPFRSVTISKVVNKTYEPKLEDKMRIALTDELMKSGFVIDGSSGNRIEGNITSFVLNVLSAKNGVAVEYEVLIKGDFKLIDPLDKARVLRHQGVFIVSFSSADSLQSVVAQKEVATDRALKDFSSQIVASIIYDRPEVRPAPAKELK
jgi:outer membrane lipopolysaccharide assembly protein LptE/RlpB